MIFKYLLFKNMLLFMTISTIPSVPKHTFEHVPYTFSKKDLSVWTNLFLWMNETVVVRTQTYPVNSHTNILNTQRETVAL